MKIRYWIGLALLVVVFTGAVVVPRSTVYKYFVARWTLGADFIPPEDITKWRGITYTEKQLADFHKSLPPLKTLRWLRDREYMLVAGPSRPMTLGDIFRLKPEYFYRASVHKTLFKENWIEHNNFFTENVVGVKWYAIRKTAVPGSTMREWRLQQRLLYEQEFVPNAPEIAWAVTTYWATRGVRLFPETEVRTASIRDADSKHECLVVVGNFRTDGLAVRYSPNYFTQHTLGIAAARRLDD